MSTINLKYALIICLSAFILQACSNTSPTQSGGSYITGNITFVDTNFTIGGGQYTVALFKHEWPLFSTKPVKTEVLQMVNKQLATYKISWDGDARFYVAVAWVSYNDTTYVPPVLGTYGCDTTHFCDKNKLVYFPNYSGSYNFMSWADTSMRMFHYSK